MITNCLGCRSYTRTLNRDDVSCGLVNYNYIDDCPCTDCIIKMICEKSCPEFIEFQKRTVIKDIENIKG